MEGNEYNPDLQKYYEDRKLFSGNSVDIFTGKAKDSEIRADIFLKGSKKIRVWGQVKDCEGCPVKDVLLKLVKHSCGKLYGVAHTISDCQGFYQFDIPAGNPKDSYKIIAGKTALGTEEVIPASKLNCKNCHDNKRESKSYDGYNNYDKETNINLDKCACEDAYEYEDEYDRYECDREKADLCKTCQYYDEKTGMCHYGYESDSYM